MKRLLFLAALPLLLAAACPGDDATGPDGNASIVGSWTLQSLNGDPLPAPWTEAGQTFTVTAGSLTVSGSGTFTFTETATGRPLDQTSGAWASESAANTFRLVPSLNPGEDENDGIATVSGNTLTLTIENSADVRVYQRN